jgi:hypothetical protein
LANRVEAIIFIDYMRSGMSYRAGGRMKGTPNTNLCDLLNIPDRLETELELSKRGHVTSILWGNAEDGLLSGDAGESSPCEHYGRYNKNESRLCRCVGSSRARVVWLRIRAERRSFGIPRLAYPRWSQKDPSAASMSEEPLFDSSFKKKPKKKHVAFSEDPLVADADPTQPAPDVIDNRTTNGEAVDMGPTTAHEQIAKQQSGEVDDDFKAMFGDVKKKKKSKKEIPLDLVRVITPNAPTLI